MAQQKQQAESATGVDNTTYDLMTTLTNKLQGIATIETYKRDAQGDQEAMAIFERIQSQDRTTVDELRNLVASRLNR